MLDLLLTNCPERVHEVKVVDNLSGSDHDVVSFVVVGCRQSVHVSKRSARRQTSTSLGMSWPPFCGTVVQEGAWRKPGGNSRIYCSQQWINASLR